MVTYSHRPEEGDTTSSAESLGEQRDSQGLWEANFIVTRGLGARWFPGEDVIVWFE